MSVGLQRIAVVGCGGSGKTFVANELAWRTGLPVTHLDALYYDATWQAAPPEEFAAAQRDLVAGDRWVVEGNYAATLPIRLARADLVIVLDVHPLVCLWGLVVRRARYRGRQSRDDGVFDRITPSFVRYVLSYRRRMLPRVLALVRQHGADDALVTLRGRRRARRFLRSVSPAA